MAVLILIIVLGLLIFIHELGHFLIAKKSGIRVDEFAIGFPPTLWSKIKNGTKYSLNLIPFGGFVRIFGETPDADSLDPVNKDSFLNKSKLTQASVLIGGVLFNILFAWFLFSISLMAGFPSVVTEENSHSINESFVVVTSVFEDSPADVAGLEAGDEILKISKENMILERESVTITNLQELIGSGDGDVSLSLRRNGDEREVLLGTERGVIGGEVPAIGISMDRIGKMKLPFFSAIGEAYLMTGQMIKEITVGLVGLIGDAVTGKGSLNNVAGPIGIVGLIGNAANFGFFYLLSFTAFISINLAILNILPLPALDGGRLLILLIEAISRKQIPAKVVNTINGIGFALLILLMIVISINDLIRLF